MGCEVLQDRKVKLEEGQKLLGSFKISGFPFGDGAPEAIMDLIEDHDKKIVRFRKLDEKGRPNGKPHEWDTSQLRTAGNGLAQFATAMEVGHSTPQAVLARYIEDKLKQRMT